MLTALGRGELCACRIIGLFALALATASERMWVLPTAGLVEARKNGRWVHYGLAGADASAEVRGPFAG